MRQEQERFRFSVEPVDRGVDTSVSRRTPRRSSTLRDEPSGLRLRDSDSRSSDSNEWNRIDTSGVSRLSRLQEVRFSIHQQDGKPKEKESSPKPHVREFDGFEPFVDPNDPLKPSQPKEGESFVNLYGGAFAQKMEVNRKGVEQALKIAHLDGQVFLTSFINSQKRSSEAQGNELVAKRFLLFGEKAEEDEKDNPLYRVASVPQGWRIEINDQKLTEELTERERA